MRWLKGGISYRLQNGCNWIRFRLTGDAIEILVGIPLHGR
jgi:hypothetical protein